MSLNEPISKYFLYFCTMQLPSALTHPKAKSLVSVIAFMVFFVLLYIGLSNLKALFAQVDARLLQGIFGLVAGLLASIAFLKLGKTSLSGAGLLPGKHTLRNFGLGLGGGIFLMGLLAFISIKISGFTIELNYEASLSKFLLASVPIFLLALMEEVVCRGYPITVLLRSFGVRTTVFVSTILFICVHLAYGWPVADAITGPGIMGIVFGLSAIASRGIAMPSGLHFGMNVTTAAFGVSTGGANLFLLKSSVHQSLENYQPAFFETYIPKFIMLIVAIAIVEIYLRRPKIGK